ncbi:MAG: SDR family NAD(P)-dependent oxidoreductase [Acidobacteriota bacterium]
MTKVIIVTGGAQGIGYAICERLGRDGGKIAVFDIHPDVAESVCGTFSEKGVEATFYRCDVSDSANVTAAVEAVRDELGPVSVLVNNAGIIRANWLENISDEDWDAVLDVHLKGTFFMCRAVVPQMRANGGGKIVNISSRACRGGHPGHPALTDRATRISALRAFGKVGYAPGAEGAPHIQPSATRWVFPSKSGSSERAIHGQHGDGLSAQWLCNA